jgi:hypothetical protein
VGALLALPALSSIPGVNADEAWTSVRIDELASGARPVNGMSFYVAGLHQYLVWPFSNLLGPVPLAIRLPGALLTLVALALITWTLKRLWGPCTALAAGLLLATAPAFVMYARFGTELPALSPFFAAVSFASLIEAARPVTLSSGIRRFRPLAFALLGAAPLGLLAYNHVVLLPMPVALLCVMLVATRGRVLGDARFWAAALGFVLGCAPRWLNLLEPGVLNMWLEQSERKNFVSDLLPMFGVLAHAWDGSLLYQRFTGGNRLPVWPYPLIAFGWVLVDRLRGGERRVTPLGFHIGFGLVLGAVLTTAIAPHLSIRYAIVLHFMLPPLLAVAAGPLFVHAKASLRTRSIALIAMVIVANLVYLTTNFFIPFVKDGGGISVFPVGTRLIETSNHFAQSDGLYRRLVERKVVRVDTDAFIKGPLILYARTDPTQTSFEYGGVEPSERDRRLAKVRTALVFHNGLQWPGPDPPGPVLTDTRQYAVILEREGVVFMLDLSFPKIFRVYVAEPP